MFFQGAGRLEIHGRQYRLVLEGSLAHLRGLGNDWISPFFDGNQGRGWLNSWVGACKKASDRWKQVGYFLAGNGCTGERCLLRQHVFFFKSR